MTSPVSDIRNRRCRLHPEREAAARCPGCGRFYCRECVTDHENRVLCLDCLGNLAPDAKDAAHPASAGWMRRWIRAGAGGILRFIPPGFCGLFGLLTVWFCFYLLGRLLILIPAEYHDHLLGGG